MTSFLEALQAVADHEARRPECPMGTPEQDAAWADELVAWEVEHRRLLGLANGSSLTPPKPEAAPTPAEPLGAAPAKTGEPAPTLEVPMGRLPKDVDPEEHLDVLRVRLAGQQMGGNLRNAAATKRTIRQWCAEHGLAVPAEAQPRVSSETGDAPAAPGPAPKAKPEKAAAQVPPPPALAEGCGGGRAAA